MDHLRTHGALEGAGLGGLPALSHELRRDVLRHLLATGLVLGLGAALVGWAAGLGAVYVGLTLGLFAGASAVLWRGLQRHPQSHPYARFGPANRLTLGRLAAVSLFAAVAVMMAWQPLPQLQQVAWGLVVLATLAAVADVADGPLARVSHMASPFGARFDMETDALLTLVLCVLVLQFGKAGPWLLAAGLMRYAFVAAGAVPRWQWLNGSLPPSLRRKTVCVLLIVVLITCLGPIIPPLVSNVLAGVGLVAVTGSFAVDIVGLARARG